MACHNGNNVPLGHTHLPPSLQVVEAVRRNAAESTTTAASSSVPALKPGHQPHTLFTIPGTRYAAGVTLSAPAGDVAQEASQPPAKWLTCQGRWVGWWVGGWVGRRKEALALCRNPSTLAFIAVRDTGTFALGCNAISLPHVCGCRSRGWRFRCRFVAHASHLQKVLLVVP